MKIPRLAVLLFSGVVAFITATLLASLLYIHINRDEFIQYFLDHVNEGLLTPVKVGEIDISYWESFPDVSIVLENVEAGTPDSPLLTIGKLSFSFHLWDFLDKNYQIRQLYLERANIFLTIDKNGKRNFDVFEKKGTQSSNAQLSIGRIKMVNSTLRYQDEPARLLSHWQLTDAQFDIQAISSPTQFSGQWKGTNIETRYQGFSYLEDRPMEIALDGVMITKGHLQEIKQWKLVLANHQVAGKLLSPAPEEMSIEWAGSTKLLSDLLANVPADWPSNWPSYQLEGEAIFEGGYSKSSLGPQLRTSFKGQNLSFAYPSRQLMFNGFEAEGILSTNLKASGTALALRSFSGAMAGFPIKGAASVSNMATMQSRAELEGSMTMALFEQIMPDWGIKSESGSLNYALGFEGALDEKSTGDWLVDGEATIENASFLWKSYPLKFDGWNGTLLFNDRDVALSDASGKLGNSELKLEGLLRNFHFFYEAKNNLLLVEGKMSARRLDLNELLADTNTSSAGGQGGYSMSISPRLHMKLEAEAETVVFDRFTGTDLSTNVTIRNRQLYVQRLDLSTMGGQISLTGNVADQPDNRMLTYFSGEVKNLHIDSLFYVFHDFDQTWLQSKHLKGQIDADFDVDMALRNSLSFLPDLFRARINARGINGELINFEPMQELSRLVKEDKLARLTFGELSNEFLIEGRKILIPSMEIRSNVSNITMSGTHTFDQQIDYRLKVPVFNQRKRDRDEAFGAIEEDERGNVYAYVKIVGTTDDYKVSYDAATAAKSLIENIKTEGKVLMREIKNNPVKDSKTLQLEDDNFFEFEADTLKKSGGS